MIRETLIVVAAMLGVACFANSQDFTSVFTEEAVPAKVVSIEDAAVRIYSSTGRSSGINTARGVLTCVHCVSKPGAITVRCGGEEAIATVIWKDEPNDVALLAVTWKKPHKVVQLADAPAVLGEQVSSVGRCVDGTINVTHHKVLEVRGNDVYTSNPFPEGRSGSALLNAQNELVGIVKAKDLTYEPYRGMSTGLVPLMGLLKAPQAAPAPPKSQSRRRVIVATAVWCTPCRVFKDAYGPGNESVELIYVDVGTNPVVKPANVTQAEFNTLLSSINTPGEGVDHLLPLAMWEVKPGDFKAKTIGGWTLDSLSRWVGAN